MKRIVFLLLLMPFFSPGQSIKVNEIDKFIHKRRIETLPLIVRSEPNVQMYISFFSIGSSFYVQLSGYGVGTRVVNPDDRVIFLLDNDSTVTGRSINMQSYDVGKAVNTYQHDYLLSLPDLEKLCQHNMQALRKYYSEKFDDIVVPKENSEKVRKLSLLFMEQLKIAKVLPLVKPILLKDIAKHIGDSVSVVGRISTGRYLAESKGALTLLNVGAPFPNELLTVVIRGTDRANFDTDPEHYYPGKEVRITGKVELYNKKPQIVIRNKEQLVIIGDTASFAQGRNGQEPAPVVATSPAFPGGQDVWISFLNRNLNPPAGLAAGEKKVVVVQFLVGADGAASDFRITKSAGPSYDNEVLRVLKRMPKWKSAVENGRPADAIVTQSITFSRAGSTAGISRE